MRDNPLGELKKLNPLDGFKERAWRVIDDRLAGFRNYPVMPRQVGGSVVRQSGGLLGVAFDPALYALDNQLLGRKVVGCGLVAVGLVARPSNTGSC